MVTKMNEPTQEQIKEFWEGCGLHIAEQTWVDDHYEPDGQWYDANGHLYTGDYLYGIPVLDLNNLFRYAVPKLIDRYGGILFVLPQSDFPSWDCKILNTPNDEATFGYGKDPALALFWSIRQVLQSRGG